MRHVFIILGLLLCIAFLAPAVQAHTIDVVTEEWTYCTNADGTGLYFDLLRLVYESHGFSLNIQILPYARAVAMVQNKAADLVIGPYEDEAENLLFPEIPFASDVVAILYLSPTEFHGQESLENTHVTFIRGYAFDEYVDVSLEVTEISHREQAIHMVQAGRADFFIDNIYDIEETIADMGLDIGDFQTDTLFNLPMFMCFAETPRGEELAAIWDEEYRQAVQSGLIAELFAQYEMILEYDALLETYDFQMD